MWRYAIPSDSRDQHVLQNSVGTNVSSGYVAYLDAREHLDPEHVLATLEQLRGVRHGLLLGILATPATLLAGRYNKLLARCHTRDFEMLVELRGAWAQPTLELLVAARPTYLRIGPDLHSAVANSSDQFRAVVKLAECARRAAIPLVARGDVQPADLRALRIAGIEYVQLSESALDLDEMLFATPGMPSLRVENANDHPIT